MSAANKQRMARGEPAAQFHFCMAASSLQMQT